MMGIEYLIFSDAIWFKSAMEGRIDFVQLQELIDHCGN
jgi:hypothetical protein